LISVVSVPTNQTRFVISEWNVWATKEPDIISSSKQPDFIRMELASLSGK